MGKRFTLVTYIDTNAMYDHRNTSERAMLHNSIDRSQEAGNGVRFRALYVYQLSH